MILIYLQVISKKRKNDPDTGTAQPFTLDSASLYILKKASLSS